MEDLNIGTITIPHTLAGDYSGDVPAPSESSAEGTADAQLRQLIKNANFVATVNAATAGYWRNDAEASGSPAKLISRMATVKIQDKMDDRFRRQQQVELDKARKLEEDAQRKANEAKRFRKLMAISPREEEEGLSEWDILMRGGMSMDELMMFSTMVKPALGGVAAPNVAAPSRSSLALAA